MTSLARGCPTKVGGQRSARERWRPLLLLLLLLGAQGHGQRLASHCSLSSSMESAGKRLIDLRILTEILSQLRTPVEPAHQRILVGRLARQEVRQLESQHVPKNRMDVIPVTFAHGIVT